MNLLKRIKGLFFKEPPKPATIIEKIVQELLWYSFNEKKPDEMREILLKYDQSFFNVADQYRKSEMKLAYHVDNASNVKSMEHIYEKWCYLEKNPKQRIREYEWNSTTDYMIPVMGHSFVYVSNNDIGFSGFQVDKTKIDIIKRYIWWRNP